MSLRYCYSNKMVIEILPSCDGGEKNIIFFLFETKSYSSARYEKKYQPAVLIHGANGLARVHGIVLTRQCAVSTPSQ